ncbi:L,D-transpeptidase family protein [Pyxidicoccus caerfyrddinensis]|uniref:L,D-transpeptidase family protein n=1 Tax=Pyxidicoccus caerfyrddinensis TaxID=2709663 RepID=UPI0013DACF10|nr:L,D-transpeptidase family protein [Pyxidicoccus caerfyrddinensis]
MSTTPADSTTLRNGRFAAEPELTQVLTGRATLGRNARGMGAQSVQQALLDMGFSLHGGADGAFGPQSLKAVRNFQVHAQSAFSDVQPTGVVDAATLRALDTLAPLPNQRGQLHNVPVPRYDGTPLRVLVVKNEHRTFLFDAQGGLQGIFGNAVGARATPTDRGLKKVSAKLGAAAARALGLKLWGGLVYGPCIIDLSWADGSRSGEELHGTNAPTRLGEDVSHGCIRHDNAAILVLFEAVKVGDWVAVVDSVRDARLGAPASSSREPLPGVA